MEDCPLGIVCLMGRTVLAGHVADLPHGGVVVKSLGSPHTMRFSSQAIYSRINDVSAVDLERLGGKGTYNDLSTHEIVWRLEGDGTSGTEPILGMVVELRSSRQRWRVLSIGEPHLLLGEQDKDGNPQPHSTQLLKRADWHKAVHTIHSAFPPPAVGMRVTWQPNAAGCLPITGTVCAESTIEWEEPGGFGERSRAKSERVLVLDNGQRLPADAWGDCCFWDNSREEMHQGRWSVSELPSRLSPPPTLPKVGLGALGGPPSLATLFQEPIPEMEAVLSLHLKGTSESAPGASLAASRVL